MAAYSGIYVWSLAFLLMVYGPVKRHRRREQEHLCECTAIGYFYTGFELPYRWWKLLVKRFDTYLIYIVTYTQFANVKSKLVVWMVIAAAMLTISAGHHPSTCGPTAWPTTWGSSAPWRASHPSFWRCRRSSTARPPGSA